MRAGAASLAAGALSVLASSTSSPPSIPRAILPPFPPTYQMNLSTVAMMCNDTGFLDPGMVAPWGMVWIDWSNRKEVWAKQAPMTCEEDLITQLNLTLSTSPYPQGQKHVFVYRNSIKALPWFTSVRIKVQDPAYAAWFMPFTPTPPISNGSYYSNPCDTNLSPPLCSMLYHDQSQSPAYPQGDGNCAAPACNVGSIVPSGEYLLNPLAMNVSINNQTLLEWYIDEYLFGASGGTPLASGFFLDDTYDPITGPTEYEAHVLEDLGLSVADTYGYSIRYWQYMATVYEQILARGSFSWQQLWVGQETGPATTCPAPLVSQNTCASDLRNLCNSSSQVQSRAMMYSFYPGNCGGDPSNLTQFDQDLANFLLIRGPYAYLGTAWVGCSMQYTFPEALHGDYGEPIGLCSETAPGSEVFTRDWTKASVQMDCNTWTPTITMK